MRTCLEFLFKGPKTNECLQELENVPRTKDLVTPNLEPQCARGLRCLRVGHVPRARHLSFEKIRLTRLLVVHDWAKFRIQ